MGRRRERGARERQVSKKGTGCHHAGWIVKRVSVSLVLLGIVFTFFAVRNTHVNKMRVDPAEFRQKSLRVHGFLSDVPLHDVWLIRLEGGGSDRTVSDVLQVFSQGDVFQTNLAVRTLFAIRRGLGQLFGWDGSDQEDSSASYIARLSEAEASRSLDQPGTRGWLGRVVYTFEHEALLEVINATVHAFVLLALEPGSDGYRLYWAIYVKPVSWLTPIYMAVIDPVRRLVIYPALITHIESAWRAKWGLEIT